MDNNKGNNDISNEIMEDVMNMIENGNDSSSADDSSDIEVLSMSSNSSKNQQTPPNKHNKTNTVPIDKRKLKRTQQSTDKNNNKYNCRIHNSTDLSQNEIAQTLNHYNKQKQIDEDKHMQYSLVADLMRSQEGISENIALRFLDIPESLFDLYEYRQWFEHHNNVNNEYERDMKYDGCPYPILMEKSIKKFSRTSFAIRLGLSNMS